MPVSSIPSRYGIGTFSKQAYSFIDSLEKAGQSYWQILPLGPTGYGDSPYQSFSTFAGNPYYIDLETLVGEGYLTREDCERYDFGDSDSYVDYEKIYLSRFRILKTAFLNSNIDKDAGYRKFVKDNSYWLDDYALYMAVKNAFGGVSWSEWDEDIKLRKPAAMKHYREKYAGEVDFYKFQQYMFAKQWFALKAYANSKNIQIIGDIPIYVAFDSSDTWANPELFQLDDDLTPVAVAGCPPDAFSATGQLWGNPLYRWEHHIKTGYAWWMKRIAYCYELYDVVRIDHFRGFDAYYSIPYGDPTAEYGHWEKGPGYDIFRTMKNKLGNKPVIAEDLGFLTKSVINLVKKTGYPGMKILQFAFDPMADSEYLPCNIEDSRCVIYTPTHDSDTACGWAQNLSGSALSFCLDYCGIKSRAELPDALLRLAWSSTAEIAIAQPQDILGLGNEARINTPSTVGLNWRWRISKEQLDGRFVSKLRRLTETYNRAGNERHKTPDAELGYVFKER